MQKIFDKTQHPFMIKLQELGIEGIDLNLIKAISLPTKVHLVKVMVFPVVMYGCESWTIKKAEHQGIDAFGFLFVCLFVCLPFIYLFFLILFYF